MENYLYNWVYLFFSTYIFPSGIAFPNYNEIVIMISMIVTLLIVWSCFIRPFWWFFKYGMFGGSKKNKKINNFGNKEE